MSGETHAKGGVPVLDEVAANLGMEPDAVRGVVDEFMLQLHKRFIEYEGLNGDYLGEQLHWEVGHQAFFHLLGFLDRFAEKYQWEPGTANEYLMRLGSRADWLPYSHQCRGWKEAEFWKPSRSTGRGEGQR